MIRSDPLGQIFANNLEQIYTFDFVSKNVLRGISYVNQKKIYYDAKFGLND